MAMKSNLLNMSACLTIVCLVCSGLLAGVYALTADPIARTNAANLRASVSAVLPDGGEISDRMTVEVGGQPSEYYVSMVGDSVAAYAVKSVTAGFGGPLALMVGITSDGQIYNTSVLEHSETPGLGAKCKTDIHFINQFKGFDTSSRILSVKKDGGDVDAITASTITSRAYTLAIRNAVDAVTKIKGE